MYFIFRIWNSDLISKFKLNLEFQILIFSQDRRGHITGLAYGNKSAQNRHGKDNRC